MRHNKIHKMTCVPSEFSYHPAQPRNLIRVCVVRIKKLGTVGYQVANKTGLSSLSIFQETRLLVCNLLKSVSLASKVTVKCCKINYPR